MRRTKIYSHRLIKRLVQNQFDFEIYWHDFSGQMRLRIILGNHEYDISLNDYKSMKELWIDVKQYWLPNRRCI